MSRHAIYLKTNNGSRLALDNLDRWMKVAFLMGGGLLCIV